MVERSHLSIGEVLSLLREEFPDVTISKIRFLESQGLVDPERTPSGYRKFYEHDVERLRWILRQQRENFLPLKIIRGRLTEQGEDLEDTEPVDGQPGSSRDSVTAGAASGAAGSEGTGRAAGREATIEAAAANHPSAAARPSAPASESSPAAAGEGRDPGGAAAAGAGVPRPGPADSAATAATTGTTASTGSAASPGPGGRSASPQATGRPASAAPGASSGGAGAGPGNRLRPAAGQVPPELGQDAETYSVEELASAAGGTVAMVTELQQYGLITSRTVVGGTPYFDASALAVTRAAAGFSRHGVEARHLRAWRNSADREAGLFEQVIMPLLRQRNPEARRQAAATLSELTSLGGDLRKALIDQAVRQIH